MKNWRFHTRVIHEGLRPEDWEGATLPPIYQTASHRHPTAESLSAAFGGQSADHIYLRLSNPTNRFLEEKLAALEGGAGAILTSSGMAAIANACLALLRPGDEFVAGNSLFMSTYVLFANIFPKYGITARFVEPTDLEALKAALSPRTRFIFVETIGNPKMDVPDLAALAEIAHENGLPLIVDNTLATPYLCRPIELGADIVIHSTTKYLSGHGCATGGVIIDSGRFDWTQSRFAEDFKPFVDRRGPLAYLDKVWREYHINFGTTQAPFHAYLTALGLDTLALRMERHCENALKVAQFLSEQPEVQWVRYPGLPDHPHREVAERQFQGKGFGGLLTFGLKDQETCFRFIRNLRLVYHLANLGDCKTLIIHPYSSQYLAFPEDLKRSLSITPDLLRLSVGLEDVEDICEDLRQALDKVK
ncbi:O-acetylhomoserine aminocarboxypropyltransferase/cysteine synthase [Thermosulfurimonas marina]|uniref:O-acetylhomoserine aminocarboxypropyltransferase/cysteine synthase n=1 Tax=Thermosulfurimonas marina TaxID=2047767 RepID=A0A6H1WQJ0_9BACT|nr:aminotransferase class I/II-fold pyridoxal phosphate-dependent enzyme [Thermosulfurimonas marina]QJA05406.1 O-acetylhomoserine aminocarboxypropyltransferase/cysteine synthase [Thermosulfurimonas marina]